MYRSNETNSGNTTSELLLSRHIYKLFSNIFVASLVNYYTVQSAEILDIPKSLIIPSCNLELGRTIGQGKNNLWQGAFLLLLTSRRIRDSV